jgi:G3E family GTPase
MKRVRFVMLGGFLGAGKTTAIARLARHHMDQGRKVGIVTNDQAYNLVDTQSLKAQGFDVGEVPGACFCCKFDDLVESAGQLSEQQHPDVIICEPVGSCTDLVATVVEPLRHLHGDRYDLAPYIVLLKPEHGQKILLEKSEAGFSSKAEYIFLKQIEEADVVVLNKVDKLTNKETQALISAVSERYPGKEVLAVSAREGDGFDALIEAFDRSEPLHTSPEIDYDIYAEGEAELGWLNCTAVFTAKAQSSPVDVDQLLVELVQQVQSALKARSAEAAHLKILAEVDDQTAIANLVGSEVDVELSRSAGIRSPNFELTVNARVAMDPESLTELMLVEIANLAARHDLNQVVSQVQSFRPGRPVPTHRMPVKHPS